MPVRLLPGLSVIPWLLAAAVAALTSQNYLTAHPGTVAFLLLTAAAGLLMALALAFLPRWLQAMVLAGAALLALDVYTQGLILLNNLVADHGLEGWPRRITYLSAFVGVFCVLVFGLGRRLPAFLAASGLFLLGSALIFPHADQALGWSSREEKAGPLGKVVVHLVMDEHIGPMGLRAANPNGRAADDLAAFYLGQGFVLYDGAYSRYSYTEFSIPTFLDLQSSTAPVRSPDTLIARWRQPMEWFRRLHDAGYSLELFSVGTSWNLCIDGMRAVADSCAIAGDRALVSDRAFVVPTNVPDTLAQSISIVAARSPLLAMPMERLGWMSEVRGQGPAHGLMTLDRIAREIQQASGDRAWFAHTWFPHEPAMVTSDCRTRMPPAEETAEEAYAAYEAQVACTRLGVLKIIGALKARDALDRATIIVQGDHGLRPLRPGYDPETWRTVTHSALFAVRALSTPPGAVTCAYDLSDLMVAVARGGEPQIGSGEVLAVQDKDFWFSDAGRRRPELAKETLSHNPATCTGSPSLPGVF